MWSALQIQPLKPWPPRAISTTTKPSPRRRSMVVRNTQNREQMDGIKFNERPHDRNIANSKTKTKSPSESAGSLSGSDILMALQRATVQKQKQKQKQKPIIRQRNRINRTGENRGGASSQPLRIKPEWRDRLLELESRFQELAHGR